MLPYERKVAINPTIWARRPSPLLYQFYFIVVLSVLFMCMCAMCAVIYVVFDRVGASDWRECNSFTSLNIQRRCCTVTNLCQNPFGYHVRNSLFMPLLSSMTTMAVDPSMPEPGVGRRLVSGRHFRSIVPTPLLRSKKFPVVSVTHPGTPFHKPFKIRNQCERWVLVRRFLLRKSSVEKRAE